MLANAEAISNRALNFLLLWNGGGAVALLSYMGAVDAARTDRLALTALGSYMLGLLCVGIAMAVFYEASRRSYEKFNDAAGEFYLRRMGWNELWGTGEPLPVLRYGATIIGYVSLLAAAVGSGLGVWSAFAVAGQH